VLLTPSKSRKVLSYWAGVSLQIRRGPSLTLLQLVGVVVPPPELPGVPGAAGVLPLPAAAPGLAGCAPRVLSDVASSIAPLQAAKALAQTSTSA
jgi:hypothetical protein